MIILNQKDSTPIFQQVKKQIIEFIALGVYTPNEQLPSVRVLANQLGINPNTVSRAYNELESEGYIYSIAGKGSFISDNDLSSAMRKEKLKNVYDCVVECRKYEVCKDDILDVINDIYGKV